MKNAKIYYSVGGLLYTPGNNTDIAHALLSQKFPLPYSLAFCLEDTVPDHLVEQAESTLLNTLGQIHTALEQSPLPLPQFFIRVRNGEQMKSFHQRAGSLAKLLTGYIASKFSMENCRGYLETLNAINTDPKHPVFLMPIYESASLIDPSLRIPLLLSLKEELKALEPFILGLRVGGNDLCHIFGLRRRATENIYQIRPVADIFTDLVSVYGRDYVISGPVWEYFGGPHWQEGLEKEMALDSLAGFTGKTLIHPNQLPVFQACSQVDNGDYLDAKAILSWDPKAPSLVSADPSKTRMNEYKTHFHWAQKILYLAECFGVKEE